MRPLLLLSLTACAVNDAPIEVQDWARGSGDTADTGSLDLVATNDSCPDDPNKDNPGFCGCEWFDVDLDATPGAETCIHITASIADSATLAPGAEVGPGAFVAARAIVGAGAVIGAGTVVGRRSQVGANSNIGPDSVLGRAVQVGDNVNASLGGLQMGYGSMLGASSITLGSPVTIGALVTVGTNARLAQDTVLARGVTLGDRVELGVGAILGPDTSVGNDVTFGTGARVRKNSSIGSDSTIEGGARLGRNANLSTNTTVGQDAVLGANVTVLTNASVDSDERIPRNTTVEAIDNCNGQAGFDHVWDGSASNSWNDADNWTPVGVPSATDTAYICGLAPTQPRLSANVTLAGLAMSVTSTLDTWIHTVTLLGDLDASVISGPGRVYMNGAGTLAGQVQTLEINANITLTDDVVVPNRLLINSGGTLTVGNHVVDAQGLFEHTLTAPGEGLRFTHPGATLKVQSSRWHGTATMSDANLNQGTLLFRGNLIADDSPAGLLRVGGALAIFDGGVGQAINIPGSSATTSFFTNVLVRAAEDPDPSDGTPGDITYAQTQQSNPLYIKGDLTLEPGGRLDVGLSTLTVEGDIDVQAGAGIRDQLGITRLHGTLSVDDAAQMDMHRLIVMNHLPRPAGSWTVQNLQVEGDITLSSDWAYRQSQFRIEPTGSLTLNGHAFVINGTYIQDIGTNSTAGLRMSAGDRAVFLQGSNFDAAVDMAGTNFTGGTVEARSSITTQAVDFRTVFMPGTELILNTEISQADLETFLTAQQITDLELNLQDAPSLILYMGNGLARFGTVRVEAGTSTATNSVSGAGSVFDNLIMSGNITPNKDLTITDTLTVNAGGGVGSTGGTTTTVLGACIIAPGGSIHANVSCP